tara:strand:+ start:13778 stop:14413 length:636 start_codon:yes stop_codon:yes gene_type:complete
MDLKNITMDDLKEKLQSFEKKTLIKFGIGIGAFILFLIIYFAIISPMIENRKLILEEKNLKLQEIQNFENEIVALKKKIKKLEPIVKKNSRLFHSKSEVEGLYDGLSRFASAYGLVIVKIEKKKPEPVMKRGKKKQDKSKLKQNMISYYKIPVNYEIKGNFLNYIKFKRAVSKSKKMLNFEEEEISLQKDLNNTIVAKGELTVVGLPDEFF